MQCSDVLTETGVRSFPRTPFRQNNNLRCNVVKWEKLVLCSCRKNSADVADAGVLVSTQKRISIWGGCLIGNS